MGYNTYVTGELRVRPKLSDKDIEALDAGPDGDSNLFATSAGDDDTVELVNGEITVVPGKSWTVVRPRSEEPHKAYDLPSEVQKLAEVATKRGCKVTGALYLDGEDSNDLSRIRVDGAKAVQEEPKFVWPNGDEGWPG